MIGSKGLVMWWCHGTNMGLNWSTCSIIASIHVWLHYKVVVNEGIIFQEFLTPLAFLLNSPKSLSFLLFPRSKVLQKCQNIVKQLPRIVLKWFKKVLTFSFSIFRLGVGFDARTQQRNLWNLARILKKSENFSSWSQCFFDSRARTFLSRN